MRKTIVNEKIIKWRTGKMEEWSKRKINAEWNNDTRMIYELKSTNQ